MSAHINALLEEGTIDELRDLVRKLVDERDDLQAALRHAMRKDAEIERLREALERVSKSNNLPFIWETAIKALAARPEAKS